MKFAQSNIWILSLFWLVPALVIFYIYAFKKREKLIGLFCKSHLKGFIIQGEGKGRQRFKAAMAILCVIFLILALMRPRWGFHWEEIRRVGVDVIVAVDCSQSMMAEDVTPNRLERAKREIQDLLGMMEGDRIGLVAFAGKSFVQCPLTLDYGAFRIFLDYLDTDLIPVQGTAIAQAIRECTGCFDRTQKGSKAIILITDGEDHEGDPLEAATEAKGKGIKIFPIGIGKEGGAPVPEKDGSGFKKDRNGNLILTKLDEKTLQRIALETGGSYVRSVTGDMDLEEIYLQGIRRMDQMELASTKKRIWEERFQWAIFIALICLLIRQFLPERRRIRVAASPGMRDKKGGAAGNNQPAYSLSRHTSETDGATSNNKPDHTEQKRRKWFSFKNVATLAPAKKDGTDGNVDGNDRNGQGMRMVCLLPLLLFSLISGTHHAHAGLIPSSRAREAQKLYQKQEYDKALPAFLDAQIDAPEDPLIQYNIANTYYRMKNYEEAARNYQIAATNAPDIDLEAKAYYNLGDCSYRMGKLDEAIAWYQKALELRPDDVDAKQNLEFVREEIKRRIEEMKNKQGQEGQQGEQGEQKREQQEGQTAQGGEQKKQEGEKQEQAQGKKEGQQEEQKQGQGKEGEKQGGEIKEAEGQAAGAEKKKGDGEKEGAAEKGYEASPLSKEEAERLLESLDEEQRKELRKKAIQGGGTYTPEKDW